jgi:hypothetical protein
MSLFKRVFDDYFDDQSDDKDDPDLYDESNQISNPGNPVWEGSDVHTNPYGTDTTVPDPNEINSD